MNPTEILWRVQQKTHFTAKRRVRRYSGMYAVTRGGYYLAVGHEDFRRAAELALGRSEALSYLGGININYEHRREIAASYATKDLHVIAVLEDEWSAGRFSPDYRFVGEDLNYAVDAFLTAYSATYLTTSLTIHSKPDGERWLQIDLRRNPTLWHFATRNLPQTRGSFLVALSDVQVLEGSSLNFRLELDGEVLCFQRGGVVQKLDGLVTVVL